MAKRTKLFLVLGVAVLVVLGTIALASLLPKKAPATPTASISFVSFTNSAAGGPTAVFSVKNQHPRALYFCVTVPQVHSTSGWPGNISWPPSPTLVPLAGNQSTNFTVSVPTNELCRVPIIAYFVRDQFDHWRDVLKVNWAVYRETGTLPGLNIGTAGSGWTNFTDELTFSIER
jgi:hypothetical protein